MKRILLVAAVVLAAAASPAHALNNSLQGGTGLVNMRTAATLDRGDVDLGAFVWNDRYAVPGGTKSDLLFMPAVNYGLWNNIEIGVSAPFVDNIDASDTGVRFFRGYGKFRFLNMPEQGLAAAVTAFAAVSTTDKPDLASGAHNYGAELDLSLPRLLAPVAALYLSAGWEKSDTRVFSVAPVYRREIKGKLDIGLDVPLQQDLNASLELLYTRSVDGDDNLLVVPGVRWQLAHDLTLIGGVGVGVPKNKSEPRWRLLAGISYIPHAAPASSRAAPAPVAPNPPPVPAQPGGAGTPPAPQTQAAPQPEPQPQGGGRPAAGAAPATAARIEVLDASGVAGLADRLAQALVKRGYKVVHIGDAGWDGQIQTQIFYVGGYEKAASNVARDIPGNQMVFEHDDLTGTAHSDVQVIVGQDLNQVYR